MQTKNIIQSQANVIRITSLNKGNTIKLVEKEYSDSYKTWYGVVLDILNSGTETFVQILKYKKEYGGLYPELKTYSGNDDLTIFPATVEEIKEFFSTSLKSFDKIIEEDKKQLQVKIEARKQAEEFVSGEMSKNLSVPGFEELSQKEFETKQIESVDKS